jgi:hypothetical protein
MHQRRNAYLIGANGPEKQQNVMPLKYAEKDIGRLQKALSTYPCEFTNVEGIIASTPFAVLPGLERLANVCKRSDLLMVHFAGHAFPWGGHLYLICNQTDVDQKLFTSTAIDINAVKNILNQCHAKHKLLVLDCCHAGTAHGGGTWRGEQELEYALGDLKGSASIILSACASHKRTRELDTLELDNEYGAGFLSWALASAFTRDFASIVDDQALSFTDLWKWLPEALSKVNKDLKINEKIRPVKLREPCGA